MHALIQKFIGKKCTIHNVLHPSIIDTLKTIPFFTVKIKKSIEDIIKRGYDLTEGTFSSYGLKNAEEGESLALAPYDFIEPNYEINALNAVDSEIHGYKIRTPAIKLHTLVDYESLLYLGKIEGSHTFHGPLRSTNMFWITNENEMYKIYYELLNKAGYRINKK